MRQLKQAFPLLLVLLLAGCSTLSAPAPETNIERLTYVEAAYGAVLDSATRLRDDNQLTDRQIRKITKAFDDYEAYRQIAQTAIDLTDDQAFDSSIEQINSVLATVRVILSEAEE